jgi:hypothetical protein
MARRSKLLPRRTSDATPRHDEQGAALILALVVLIVGSIIVGALASYVIADYKALPAIETRTNRAEALKGGVRMAINNQREYGPTACAPVTNFTLNGMTVQTTCTAGVAEMVGGGRYGLVSTSNKATSAHVTGVPSGSTGFVKSITSPIFLNSGRLSTGTADVAPTAQVTMSTYTSPLTPAARYSTPSISTPFGCDNAAQAPALAASDLFSKNPPTVNHTLVCQAQPWWTVVGQPNAAGTIVYPALPPIPKFERTGSPASLGACKIFYPGRYLMPKPTTPSDTSNILTLDGGTHYFTSGVYYFERPIRIIGGAKVVMGRGPTGSQNCATDATAAGATSRPPELDISGRGVTFIFGKIGNLEVSGASTSVVFHPRYATALTAASDGVNIRTVSSGAPTANIEIPEDKVQLPNGTLVNVTAYTSSVGSGPAFGYSGSTLTHDQTAVWVRTSKAPPPSSNTTSNTYNNVKVIVPGFVITPHARFVLEGTGNTPNLQFRGGLVASEFRFTLNKNPVANTWAMGAVPNVGQRGFSFVTSVTDGSRTLSSRATLELDQTGQFAISGWSVDV